MPIEGERIARLEVAVDDLKQDSNRFREHIGKLLAFKSQWEGSMTTLKYLVGFVGFSNLILLFKMFYRHG